MRLKKCVNLVSVKLFLIYNMYLPRLKKALFVLTFTFAIILKLDFRAYAQHRSTGMNAEGNLLSGSRAGSGGSGYIPSEGWAIALNGGYEMPLGDIREFYKPAPTFGATIMRRWNHFIFSGSVDYRVYQPKQSSFSNPVNVGGQITTIEVMYSDFSGMGLYAGAAYEMPITYAASFYVGLNVGTIMSNYDYAILQDNVPVYTDRLKTNVTYVGPKLGLNFAVAKGLILGVEAKYNVSLAKASNDPNDNSVTKGFNSAAANLFLSYSF